MLWRYNTELLIFCANSFDKTKDYCEVCGAKVDSDYFVVCIKNFHCFTICKDCYDKLITTINR